MSKNRKNWRKKRAHEEALERRNALAYKTNGHADPTPYNAINGKDIISKATLSEVKTKVNGSFNG